MTLLSYPYTNEMDFAPLQTSARDSNSVVNAKAQQRQPCSPRSMYSLATAVRISHECTMLSPDLPRAWNREHQGGRTEGPPV